MEAARERYIRKVDSMHTVQGGVVVSPDERDVDLGSGSEISTSALPSGSETV